MESDYFGISDGIWLVLKVSAYFGLVPLSGVKTKARFTFKSVRTWFCIFLLLNKILLFLSYSHFVWKLKRKLQHLSLLDSLGVSLGFIYYTHVITVPFLLLIRAQKFPKLLRFCEIEDKADFTCKNYRTLIYTVVISYTSIALLGHVLFTAADATKNNVTNANEFFSSVVTAYGIPEYLTSSDVLVTFWGIYCLLLDVPFALSWYIPDIIIFVASLMLTRKFKELNKQLKYLIAKYEILPIKYLLKIRNRHSRYVRIVESIDDIMSLMVLVSLICNSAYLFMSLYVGLFKDLRNSNGYLRFHGMYAASILISRVMAPIFVGAFMNEQAHSILPILHRCRLHSKEKRLETNKVEGLFLSSFMYQVDGYNIGFTGGKFFIITKSFVLSIMGAFLTYEVIILQFKKALEKNAS